VARSTVAGESLHEEEVKRSRFVARAASAASPGAALAFVESVSDPKATHNPWAYRIGAEYRFSDDGEPGGTAGRPILGAIERLGLDDVVVVVTRYFGGIKLGAGGLARAYGGAAASCLRSAGTREVRVAARATIAAGFEWVGQVQALVDRHGAERLGERYTGAGVEIDVRLDAEATEPLSAALREATRGGAVLRLTEADGSGLRPRRRGGP
jgi:uncharacterized YigZ family protein